jgi:hypothetical protein
MRVAGGPRPSYAFGPRFDGECPLSNMRSHGRNHVFVYCSNPDCHHNAEIDASGFPDDVTFGDLQPRMLCTVCDHRGADVSPSWTPVTT